MPLSEAQKVIASDKRRFRVAVCGRRFGKTHLALRELAKYASKPNSLVYYVAPSYRMAKQIMWKKLKRKLGDLRWVKKVNETELSLTLVNGSEICLRSADAYDSMRGVGLDGLILDEAADMNPEVWYEVLRPTLSDTGGKAVILGTPKGMNWLKDLWDHSKVDPDNWSSYQFTTLDGKNVPEAEVESARRDLDERTFRQEYMATFEQYSGLISYSFGEHNIAPVEKPGLNEPILIGMDFNTTPMSASILRQTKNGLEQFDEIAIEGSNTNEMIQEIRNRYPQNPIIVFPDPAGVQRKTSANGQTDIKLLQNAGFTVRYHTRHPLVKDRINAANSLFHKREDNIVRFKIDPSCKKTIKSLQNHCYKENTQVPDKDNGWDHMFDALTYAIEFLYPIKRDPSEVKNPGVWGVY